MDETPDGRGSAPGPTLADDVEFEVARALVIDAADPRPAGEEEVAECRSCGRSAPVATADRRRGNTTVRRHECGACGTRGATVVETDPSGTSTLWTAGDVESVDRATQSGGERGEGAGGD